MVAYMGLGLGFQLSRASMRSITPLENMGNAENERRELTSLTNREVIVHNKTHHSYDRIDKKRSSRVISGKTKIAKSKTQIVAKMGVSKVCITVLFFLFDFWMIL